MTTPGRVIFIEALQKLGFNDFANLKIALDSDKPQIPKSLWGKLALMVFGKNRDNKRSALSCRWRLNRGNIQLLLKDRMEQVEQMEPTATEQHETTVQTEQTEQTEKMEQTEQTEKMEQTEQTEKMEQTEQTKDGELHRSTEQAIALVVNNIENVIRLDSVDYFRSRSRSRNNIISSSNTSLISCSLNSVKIELDDENFLSVIASG